MNKIIISNQMNRVIGINSTATYADQYKTSSVSSFAASTLEHVLISELILNILNMKRHEYVNLPVSFEQEFSTKANFAFIKANERNLYSTVSNLVNNAADSLGDKSGMVKVKLDCQEYMVRMTIEDNGNGMPDEVIKKIMNNVSVVYGKSNADIVKEMRATLNIESKMGKGTKITINIPQAKEPQWAINKLCIQSDSIIIILSHDINMHEVWQSKFAKVLADCTNVAAKYFKYEFDALDFINASSQYEKDRMILLTDYELFNQQLNGLEVILESKLKNGVLVAHYDHGIPEKYIDYSKKCFSNVKFLPTRLVEVIPIILKSSVRIMTKPV